MSGCSSSPAPTGSAPPVATSAQTGGATTEPDSSIPSASTTVAMGQEGNSAGLKLTVVKVTTADSLYYTESEKTVKPAAGGKYIIVETTGTNDTKTGIDLTCGLPVVTNLYDTEGREFSGVNDVDLYERKGNPGCNDNVQPGFPFNMTWAYMVPADATPKMFQWNSLSDSLDDGPVVEVPVTAS
jgi:hypothetical protein